MFIWKRFTLLFLVLTICSVAWAAPYPSKGILEFKELHLQMSTLDKSLASEEENIRKAATGEGRQLTEGEKVQIDQIVSLRMKLSESLEKLDSLDLNINGARLLAQNIVSEIQAMGEREWKPFTFEEVSQEFRNIYAKIFALDQALSNRRTKIRRTAFHAERLMTDNEKAELNQIVSIRMELSDALRDLPFVTLDSLEKTLR